MTKSFPHNLSSLRVWGLWNTFIPGRWWLENILGISICRKLLLRSLDCSLTLLQPKSEPWVILPFPICQFISYNLKISFFPYPHEWKIIKLLGYHWNPTKTLALLKVNQNITLNCREIQWVNGIKWIKSHFFLNIITLKNFSWLPFISTLWTCNQDLSQYNPNPTPSPPNQNYILPL